MAYATVADMTERFGNTVLAQLSTLESGDPSPDTTRIDAAIADGDAVIDGYVGRRYALPLPATPALLRGISCDLAFHRLHRHGAPEEVRKLRDAALEQLERIARGEVLLEIAGVEPAAPSGGGEVTGPDRVFDRDSLDGF